jgi:hypothetical protein
MCEINITDKMNLKMKVVTKPNEIKTILVYYDPLKKGKINCDVKITIGDNPYEYFTVRRPLFKLITYFDSTTIRGFFFVLRFSVKQKLLWKM